MGKNGKENLYIRILKDANKKEKFTENELFGSLGLSSEERKFVSNHIFRGTDLFTNTGEVNKVGTNTESILRISENGIFKLLEYEQLDEARRSSKQATYIAIIAMILTIISIIAQIIYPVSLDNKQFNRIVELITTK